MLGSPDPLAADEMAHVHSCLACRDRYERVVAVERLAASGGADRVDPSALELSRVGALVLEQVRAQSPFARAAGWLRRSWTGPALAAATVAAALVAGVFLAPRQEDWTVRAGAASGFAVRAFCQLPDGTIRSLADEPGPQEVAACRADGAVLFGYLAETPGLLYALFVDPQGAVHWLAPAEGGAPAPRIDRAVKLSPLDLRLETARAGKYRVVFIEAERPLSFTQVERAVREAGASKRLEERLGGRVRTLDVYFNPVLPMATP
jgi:hypothetical protein